MRIFIITICFTLAFFSLEEVFEDIQAVMDGYDNSIKHLIFDSFLSILFIYLGIRVLKPKNKGKHK